LKIKDITGQKFGKLTVVEMLKERGNSGQIMYRCECDCGNKNHITSGASIRSGRSKSCGCNRFNPHNKLEDREYAIKKYLYNSNIVKRSKKLKRYYDISLDEYIKMIEQPCYYCGNLHSNYANDRFNTKLNNKKTSDVVVYYNGIDRIDSNKWYTKDNVVTCCKYCNMAKSTMTQKEFKDWIERVYNHYCK